jgi:HEAT repeat protein
VPRLIAALKDPDEGVCACAAQALGNLRWDAKNSVPALIDALRAGAMKRSLREGAAGALGCFGPEARPALPALRTALHDEDPSLRSIALSSLSEIDPDSEETQASLVAALRDESEMVRESTVRLCGSLGPRAQVAMPTLLLLLKDEKEEEIRYFVKSALKKIDPEGAKRAGVP